ncbi:hypothetical protein VNO77_30834 [Canavalia gladiata]|uniref:Uncharacterized protein n=1 Tax=Canavalia gladiata TaxID=3824 RepID=A0AAN9KNE1_CANGL
MTTTRVLITNSRRVKPMPKDMSIVLCLGSWFVLPILGDLAMNLDPKALSETCSRETITSSSTAADTTSQGALEASTSVESNSKITKGKIQVELRERGPIPALFFSPNYVGEGKAKVTHMSKFIRIEIDALPTGPSRLYATNIPIGTQILGIATEIGTGSLRLLTKTPETNYHTWYRGDLRRQKLVSSPRYRFNITYQLSNHPSLESNHRLPQGLANERIQDLHKHSTDPD